MLDWIMWSNPVLTLCGIGKAEAKTLRELKIEAKRTCALQRAEAAVLVEASPPIQAALACDKATEAKFVRS